jgi:hypothetical protein
MARKPEKDDVFLGTEQQFRALVLGVTDYAIYMLDPEGRVRSWNPRLNATRATRPNKSSENISAAAWLRINHYPQRRSCKSPMT